MTVRSFRCESPRLALTATLALGLVAGPAPGAREQASVDAAAHAGARYYDNILFLRGNLQSAVERTAQANLDLRHDTNDLSVQLGAHAAGRDFTGVDGLDHTVYGARLDSRYQLNRARLTFKGFVKHDGLFGSETGELVTPQLSERRRIRARPAWVWTAYPNLDVELAYNVLHTDFDSDPPNARVDSKAHTVTSTVNVDVTETTRLNGRATYQHYETSPGLFPIFGVPRRATDTDIDRYGIEAEVIHELGPTLKGSVKLGVFRDDIEGTAPRTVFLGFTPAGGRRFLLTDRDLDELRSTVVARARLEKAFTPALTAWLVFKRDERPDTTGFLRVRNRAEAYAMWRANEDLSLTFNVQGVRTEALSGDPDSGFSDFLVTPRINWNFGETASAQVAYRYVLRDEDGQADERKAHIIGLSLRYRW